MKKYLVLLLLIAIFCGFASITFAQDVGLMSNPSLLGLSLTNDKVEHIAFEHFSMLTEPEKPLILNMGLANSMTSSSSSSSSDYMTVEELKRLSYKYITLEIWQWCLYSASLIN